HRGDAGPESHEPASANHPSAAHQQPLLSLETLVGELARSRAADALSDFYALRSLIAAKISATTSPFGFAPCGPLLCKRTLTLPASTSRAPMTSMVWTRAFSASAILALIGSAPRSLSTRTCSARSCWMISFA